MGTTLENDDLKKKKTAGMVIVRGAWTRRNQIRPGLSANEIQIPYNKHHKLFSFALVKSHQNTHSSSVKYEVK